MEQLSLKQLDGVCREGLREFAPVLVTNCECA